MDLYREGGPMPKKQRLNPGKEMIVEIKRREMVSFCKGLEVRVINDAKYKVVF